jgi:hypothetical protein
LSDSWLEDSLLLCDARYCHSQQRHIPLLKADSISRYLEVGSASFDHVHTSSDMQQARYAFAARFVAAAKEGRNVVTADDIYSVHALESVARHNAYHKCLLACILVHMALPFWVSATH